MYEILRNLQERRSRLKLLLDDNAKKFLDAKFAGASFDDLQSLSSVGDDISAQIANIDAEIQSVSRTWSDKQAKLQTEKHNADVQAKLEDERQKLAHAKVMWADTDFKLKSKKVLDSYSRNVLDVLKVQLAPSSICVEPNDAFIKALFRFGDNTFKNALLGKKFGVKQKNKTSKKDAVVSPFSIQNAEGYDDDSPLDEFDRAVLGVIISEYLAGNLYTTVNIIFRALIGKVGDQNVRPMKNQLESIADSVQKLMGTVVDFSGISDSLKEMNYTDKNGNAVVFQSANLLSADILNAKVNGQEMDGVIFFKVISPLFNIADAKSQVIRYPHHLLNVPNQNNTPRIISIKKYVLRRICEIKLHKNLSPTITFDDIFKKCRMLDSPREVKRDARNAVIKFFEHLQEKNFILSFELVQQCNKFVSIKFSF